MYTRILMPTDRSAMAEQALPHAVAQAEKLGAELILLRVLEPFEQVRGLSAAQLDRIKQFTLEKAQTYLDDLVKTIECEGVKVSAAIVEGRPHAGILQYAEANQVDLIVLCTRGRSGFSRWLMGSVADRVVRGAKVPVLLVRATQEEPGA